MKCFKKSIAVLFAVCMALGFDTTVMPASVSAAQAVSSLVGYGNPKGAKVGSIFLATDAIEFTQTITNKSDEDVVSEYTWTVTDETGTYSATYNGADDLGAGETKTRNITFDNPGKYGIYTISAREDSFAASNPAYKYTVYNSYEFSVCIALDESNYDTKFGFNHKLVGVNGEYELTVPLMIQAGAVWHRESIMWQGVEPKEKGTYISLETYKERLRWIKASGINSVCVLTGRNPLYDNNYCPSSDEGIAAYANFCAFVASELSGIVDHFEVWNEWNAKNFNPSLEPPETYAKVLKAAYAAMKAANPNVTVIGCDVAGVNPAQVTWIRRVLNALNGETAMDAISVHSYDFLEDSGFPELQYVEKVRAIKDLMTQYNLDIPLWLSEVGFSTYDSSNPGFVPSCTEKEQLNSMVMLNVINKAYGLFDNLIQYCFYSKNNAPGIEYNWGVMKSDQTSYPGPLEPAIVPTGAKPAYLGIAAMNYFVGGNATFVDKIGSDRRYAFRFRNGNLDKDVIVAINGGIVNNSVRDFDLGCQSISVYDKYGNLKEEMTSKTGVYQIETTAAPTYIVGDFTKLEEYIPDIRIRAAADLNSNEITISGNAGEPHDTVSLMVVTKGSELRTFSSSRVKYLGQVTSDRQGNFSAKYTADTVEGEYQIYINTEKRRSKLIKDLEFTYSLPGISVTKNGEAITSMSQLTAGDTPSVTLTGLESLGEYSPQLIVAQYAGNELININFIDAAGPYETPDGGFETDFTVAEGADRIKVMHWYLNTLTPVIAYYEIR